MTTKTRNVIIAVILTILAIFSLGWCLGHKKAKDAYNATINALTGEVTRTTIELNNAKLYVASVEQEIETIKQAKDAGDVTNKELRALNIKQLNEISRFKMQIDTLLTDVSSNGKIVVIHDTIKSG